MSIVVVGTIGYDTIQTPAGSADGVLGGSATYFALGAGFFAPVGVVSVVGSDFLPEHRQWLAERNVDLRGLQQREGASFRWHGRYLDGLRRRETVALEANLFASFRPRLLPDQQRTDYLFLANLSPEMQAGVIQQTNQPKLIGADSINHWIAQRRRDLLRLLARIHILFANEEETRMLSGEDNLLKAGRALLALGPRVMVITRGEHGVLQLSEAGQFALPAYPLEEVIDPTGAGDTFAGAYMGYLSRQGHFDENACRAAAVYANVVASFAVERFSVERLIRLTWDEVDRRYRGFMELIDPRPPRFIPP